MPLPLQARACRARVRSSWPCRCRYFFCFSLSGPSTAAAATAHRRSTPEQHRQHRTTFYAWSDSADHAQPLLGADMSTRYRAAGIPSRRRADRHQGLRNNDGYQQTAKGHSAAMFGGGFSFDAFQIRNLNAISPILGCESDYWIRSQAAGTASGVYF